MSKKVKAKAQYLYGVLDHQWRIESHYEPIPPVLFAFCFGGSITLIVYLITSAI